MKNIFLILVIACTAMTTANAQTSKPSNVIAQLNNIIEIYGQKDSQSYSLKKDPNTGLIESSKRIVHFSTKGNGDYKRRGFIDEISNAYTKDEHICYQLLHLVPGNSENFLLKVVTNNGSRTEHMNIRSNMNQEMWLMCSKNPENPRLRDAYAIVMEEKDGEMEGDIYIITSLRPDLYEGPDASRKTFKLEGRVDANIKDSLYNVYIADSYEELQNIADDDYAACVPVVNKRFEYSVELDKPKVGRLRCIFPDGSLCSAWIDIDMVPGETYRITVHDGYYDEDRDYEQRVGRNSGKSLINSRSDFSESSERDLMLKRSLLTSNVEATKAMYKMAVECLEKTPLVGKKKKWNGVDEYFIKIIKQNKEFDNLVISLIQSYSVYGVPFKDFMDFYNELLQFLTGQNQAFNELFWRYGHLSKDARKCQKHVGKLTEKYIDEIEKNKSYIYFRPVLSR